MANVTLSNLAGFILLVMGYIMFYPMLDTGISLLLPQLGPYEGLMVKAVPLLMMFAIASELFESDDKQVIR